MFDKKAWPDTNDFAKVSKRSPHIIHLNPAAYRDGKRLAEEYQDGVERGLFVQGSDYHHIIYHEFAHTIRCIYDKYGKTDVEGIVLGVLKGMQDIKVSTTATEVLIFLCENLSIYATSKDIRGKNSELFPEIMSASMIDNPQKYILKSLEEIISIITGGRLK